MQVSLPCCGIPPFESLHQQPGKDILEEWWDGAVQPGNWDKRTQCQIALGGPRAPDAKGFVLGRSRGMTFACKSIPPCLALANAHEPVEQLSA